jgi:hypothetical protein
MSLKNETVVLRVCGNCKYANGGLAHSEVAKFEKAYLNYVEAQHVYLASLRRSANHLKDAKVFCRKENSEMGVFEEACALWRKRIRYQM